MRFLPRAINDRRPWSPMQDEPGLAISVILLVAILIFLCYREGLSIPMLFTFAACWLAWTIGFGMGILDVLHTEKLEAAAKGK
jgi:hypothetical protein